jgi:hypothetical protein
VYRNLTSRMRRKKVNVNDLAECLGVDLSIIAGKLREGDSFTLDEAILIKRRFFPESPIEYLFDTEVTNIYPGLAARMIGHGHDAKNLAELLGMSYCSVLARLRGRVDFELMEVKRLMEIYDSSCDRLFGEGNGA